MLAIHPCSGSAIRAGQFRYLSDRGTGHGRLPWLALRRGGDYHSGCVQRDAAGIAFAPPTQAVLRRGWQARRSNDQQEAVLRFLEQQLQAARPIAAPEDSLAQLLWTGTSITAKPGFNSVWSSWPAQVTGTGRAGGPRCGRPRAHFRSAYRAEADGREPGQIHRRGPLRPSGG